MFTYEEFVRRNLGYVSSFEQERIRSVRILVAGCGIGSTVAESLVRIGAENIILIDGDIVNLNNLNRQNYVLDDVDNAKVKSLAKRLKGINPNLNIIEHNDWVTPHNAKELVSRADIIFDTIDLLSLEGIVALHDECHIQKKPIIAAMSAGWGAAAVYFPADSTWTFRKLFGISEISDMKKLSYVESFSAFIKKISDKLDRDIINVLASTLQLMDDGKPCPVPQVSAGSAAVAALGITILVRILSSKTITAAPRMIMLNISDICAEQGIDLSA